MRSADHVLLVKVASTAVVGRLLATRDELINAVSNAFVDGHALRTYRHAPNTGSRKSGGRRCNLPRGAPRADRENG